KKPGAPRSPRSTPLLCVDAPVLEQSRSHRRHRALVRRRQFLQRAAGVEGGEELAILVFRPRLAGLRRQLSLATLEALLALERRCRLVQRAHYDRPLI